MLGECLLISSLPGKALRTLVDIARLAEFDLKERKFILWRIGLYFGRFGEKLN